LVFKLADINLLNVVNSSRFKAPSLSASASLNNFPTAALLFYLEASVLTVFVE